MKNEQLLIDLSDEQCEKVVGGVGIGDDPPSSAGVKGWFGDGGHGLFGAGKSPGHFDAGNSGNRIIIPT